MHEQAVRKNGVSEAEVESAKAETLNSFVFNFASTSSQLLQSLGCELLGLPQVMAGIQQPSFLVSFSEMHRFM